jgi:hypothetical protein
MTIRRWAAKRFLLSGALLLAAGCGGGGGNSSNSAPQQLPPPAPCTLLANNLPANQAINLPGCLSGGCTTGAALRDLVLDSSNVYWFEFDTTKGATGGSIKTIAKTGGSVTTVVSGLQAVNDFVVDDSNIYWTEEDIASGAGAIKTVPKTGGAVTVLATGTQPGLNGDVFTPDGIAVDSTFVYWQDINPPLRRVPKMGGAAVELGKLGGAHRMVIDAGFAYIYGAGGSGIARYPLSGGSVQVLASGSGMNVDGNIAVDDKYVYGENSANGPHGNVFEVPIGGGAAIFVVQNLRSPSIAIDGSYIYYVGEAYAGQSAVSKVPKMGGVSTAYPNCVPQNPVPPGAPPVPLAGVGTVAVDSTNVYVMGWQLGTPASAGVGALAMFPK